MILNTRRLFRRLLRTFEIETVCDVGSMDGSDALRFRRMLPGAKIIALEPNPRNFVLMDADERLRRNSIRILPLAASDSSTEVPFFVVDAEYAAGRDRFRRGMSSLHRRSDWTKLAETVQVRTVRLDELLASETLNERPTALWIDTEGTSFEVICGAAAVLPATCMIHVEVETDRIIGADQKLFRDVERELVDVGFVLLATDQPHHNLQFNALFVRADLLHTKARTIRYWVTILRARRVLMRNVVRLVPRRVQRLIVELTH